MTELSTSIILLTFRRDDATAENVARLDPLIRLRPSVEVILVDNNADGVDRRYLVAALPRAKLVTAERNAGVAGGRNLGVNAASRSEEHPSELQSLMRILYAVI